MNFYPYNHESVVLIDGDLCVISNSAGKLCGYCSFLADEIPKEWHGNYNADALQYLAIHGGITYCSVHGDNDEERYAAAKAARSAIPDPDELLSLDDRMAVYNARHKAGEDALLTVPYTHVVFGFDCAHYRDDEDYRLRDPQHVLDLARQMRAQLVAYARVLPEWRAANRDVRIEMVGAICKTAETRTEVGFGALIGMLGGAAAFGEQQTEH